LQKDDRSNSSGVNYSLREVYSRQKRIKRLKTLIIIAAIFFLILPTVCCVLLGLQVHRMQQQLDELTDLHNRYGLSKEGKDINSAYAAAKGTLNTVSMARIQKALNELLEMNILDSFRKEGNASLEKLLENQNNKSRMDRINSSNHADKALSNTGKYSKKKVYLTFDDGPSIYTDDILDILSNYEVKAAFFVIGKEDDWSKEMYRRIIEEGHALGMHSYSHKYSQIYNSAEDFVQDFTKLWKLLYDTTGYRPSIFRFPGGSDNEMNEKSRNDIIRYLNKEEIVYFDWNVVNGDATSDNYTTQQLISNVLEGMEGKDNCIVLMHDSQSKYTTVESLPGLLEALQSEGAQILPLSKDVTPIQMVKYDSVK
jgi:peptidoglycan/xylan/chitin deacetylase (PgdA/CDA1 family)